MKLLHFVSFDFNGYTAHKLEEVSKLFVDSLATFKLQEHGSWENSQCSQPTTQEGISLYYKAALRHAFDEAKGPCFMEGRVLHLQEFILFGQQLQHKDSLVEVIGRSGILFVTVYYTEDGVNFAEYTTTIGGQVVPSAGTSEALTDCMWLPNEFSKTLAELGQHLGLQNEAYLELSDKLRSHTFSGTMEIHIFVGPLNPTTEFQEMFKSTCIEQGMKACNLRLDFVKHGFLAVLMSSRYVRGEMNFIWRECFKDARILAKAGFNVIRAKIEATASIDGVPETNEQATLLPSFTYFEFHMVFTSADGPTATEDDIAQVKGIASSLEQQWHVCIPLSTNAMGSQRWLNMRAYGIGRSAAFPRLASLQREVEQHGFQVPRFIREFGVYDSDVRLDAGWLEPLQENTNYVDGFIRRW